MSDAVFLPYQRRWNIDKTQVKICEKSRRIGLTWAQAADDVLCAATEGRDGMDVLYISFNQDMTREYIETCADWVKRFGKVAGEIGEEVLKDGDEREIKAFRIDFASGHKILALSSRPSNLRGKQGRVVIDEAAFVEDLPELLKAALALLMWGGQVVVISTHNGVDNAFNELVQDTLSGRFPYSHHRITLDDALADGLYQRICAVAKKGWTPEAQEVWRADLIKTYGDGADEELFCIPNRSTGAYLTSALIEACMAANTNSAPVFTWTPPADDFVDWPLPQAEAVTVAWLQETVAPVLAELPAGRSHFVGGDFGRSGDLSVFWPLTERQNLTLATPFVVELRNCPYRTQQQILFFIIDALPRFSGLALDARGNGSALAEFARQEYGPEHVDEVMITEGWYRETMPKLKARLEDRTLILPKHADILGDLRSLRVVKGVARIPDARGKDASGAGGKRHGDAAVALAMAIHAREKLGNVEAWSCETVPRSESDIDWNGW